MFRLIAPFLQFESLNWLFNILHFKFIVPNDADGSFYHSPFVAILISMYGWVLIGLVVKFIIKRLK